MFLDNSRRPYWLFNTEKPGQQLFARLDDYTSVDVFWGKYANSSNDWLVTSKNDEYLTAGKLVNVGVSTIKALHPNWGSGKLVFVGTGNNGPIPAVMRLRGAVQGFTGVQMPPEWGEVVLLRTDIGTIVNSEFTLPNKLVADFWPSKTRAANLPLIDERLNDEEAALRFIHAYLGKSTTWWKALDESYPRLLQDVSRVFAGKSRRFVYMDGTGDVYTATTLPSGLGVTAFRSAGRIVFSDQYSIVISKDAQLSFKKLRGE